MFTDCLRDVYTMFASLPQIVYTYIHFVYKVIISLSNPHRLFTSLHRSVYKRK